MTEISIRAPVTSDDWETYYDLRYRVLREPWGQPRGSERDSTEDSAFHWMAVEEPLYPSLPAVLGVIRLDILGSGDIGQVRFMAVDEKARGRRVGSLLLGALEEFAKKKGVVLLFLQSRENAVDFYIKQGYRVEEKSHLLFRTIQHYKMIKML